MTSLPRIDVLPTETTDGVPLGPVATYLARLAPGSRRATFQVIRVIAAELGGQPGSLSWHSLGYADTQWVRSKLMAAYGPATANRALSALRGVLREAFRLGLMDAQSFHRAADLSPVRGSRILRGRALSLSEVATLFGACASSNQGARDAAVLALAFGGGLRRAEAVAVQIDDYDAASRSLTLVGKGSKARRVFFGTQCANAIDRWLEIRGAARGPLLLAVNKADRIEHRQLSPEAIAVLLKRLARRAGIASFTPHDLRRTFVSELLSGGADLATVQALAGHANPATTVRYDRRGEEAQRRAVELLKIVVSGTLGT